MQRQLRLERGKPRTLLKKQRQRQQKQKQKLKEGGEIEMNVFILTGLGDDDFQGGVDGHEQITDEELQLYIEILMEGVVLS